MPADWNADFSDGELRSMAAADAEIEREATPAAVVWPKRVCPKCGSERLKTTRSVALGDGSRMRRVRCKTCNHAFAAFLE
ncbi:MAG: hypothetical protein AAGH92_07340 [Planctomycetota bacterium]